MDENVIKWEKCINAEAITRFNQRPYAEANFLHYKIDVCIKF